MSSRPREDRAPVPSDDPEVGTLAGPTLAEFRAARERVAAVVRRHPAGAVAVPRRAARRAGAAQGREPAAHRLVQDPRRLQPARPSSAPSERARGVVAASAGNHAQGVALAARELGIHATIFMPLGVALPKLQATRGYGAEVVLHGHVVDETLQARGRVRRRAPAPCSSRRSITRTSSRGRARSPSRSSSRFRMSRTSIVPIGGGGLIAGVASAFAQLAPRDRPPGAGHRRAGRERGRLSAVPRRGRATVRTTSARRSPTASRSGDPGDAELRHHPRHRRQGRHGRRRRHRPRARRAARAREARRRAGRSRRGRRRSSPASIDVDGPTVVLPQRRQHRPDGHGAGHQPRSRRVAALPARSTSRCPTGPVSSRASPSSSPRRTRTSSRCCTPGTASGCRSARSRSRSTWRRAAPSTRSSCCRSCGMPATGPASVASPTLAGHERAFRLHRLRRRRQLPRTARVLPTARARHPGRTQRVESHVEFWRRRVGRVSASPGTPIEVDPGAILPATGEPDRVSAERSPRSAPDTRG